MTRDTQRAKVMRCYGSIVPFAEPLPEMSDVRRFVVRAWTMKRMEDAFPKAIKARTPELKDGRGCRSAWGWDNEIGAPKWSRTSTTVARLIAHTITAREHPKAAMHGREFCASMLTTVLYLIGREAHDALKAAFKAEGVAFRPKREGRKLDYLEKAKLAARLAAGRAAMQPQPETMFENVWAQRDGMVVR